MSTDDEPEPDQQLTAKLGELDALIDQLAELTDQLHRDTTGEPAGEQAHTDRPPDHPEAPTP